MYGADVHVCAPYKRKEGGKERTSEKEKKRNAKRKIEERNEREAKRKPRWRASGACSLLPDDRVHRLLLVVGAPKSRIFYGRASRTMRLAFSLKAGGKGNRKSNPSWTTSRDLEEFSRCRKACMRLRDVLGIITNVKYSMRSI